MFLPRYSGGKSINLGVNVELLIFAFGIRFQDMGVLLHRRSALRRSEAVEKGLTSGGMSRTQKKIRRSFQHNHATYAYVDKHKQLNANRKSDGSRRRRRKPEAEKNRQTEPGRASTQPNAMQASLPRSSVCGSFLLRIMVGEGVIPLCSVSLRKSLRGVNSPSSRASRSSTVCFWRCTRRYKS